MGLTKEKTAVAQSMLNRIFQTQDKHPFPLNFSKWAVAKGADINQPSHHAVVRAVIDTELLDVERGDAPHKDSKTHLPDINSIVNFLHSSGFFFKGVDQEYILQTAEDPDVAASVLAVLRSR